MQAVDDIFQPLWDDIGGDKTFPEYRPLLAHYTSMRTLELILKTNNIWFSNPLFMNDSEEISFGMLEGNKCIIRHASLLKEACKTDFAYNSFTDAYGQLYAEFSSMHVLDVYALCLSVHEGSDSDGQLSMWRGYGGNGSGAALVIDTQKLEYKEDSPFIVASVTYATTEERRQWLDHKIEQFAKLIRSVSLSNDEMRLAAYELFERVKIFSLFTKHSGFKD